MLDILHYRGLLHVARRERGIRVYALADRVAGRAALAPNRRADGQLELLVRLYAPVSRSTLRQLTFMLGERAIRTRRPARADSDAHRERRADRDPHRRRRLRHADRRPSGPSVRFLAPFDPLVWDRRRFEHLCQWRYRFEAYTPTAKRTLGYYALSLLRDDGDDARVVGWVNAARPPGRRLSVQPGHATKRPTGPAFKAVFDAEIARLDALLGRA